MALSIDLTVVMCRRSQMAVLVFSTLIYAATADDRKSHDTRGTGSVASVAYDRKSRPTDIVLPRIRRFIIKTPTLRLYRSDMNSAHDNRGWRPIARSWSSPFDKFFKFIFSTLRDVSVYDENYKYNEENDFS